MESKLLKMIKKDAISIIQTKIDTINNARSIQELIDNELCELMSCPGCYNLNEKDCGNYSCNNCWQCAIDEVK